MPTDSFEVVVVMTEVDMEVAEEAENGMDKELDMAKKKFSGYRKFICNKKSSHKKWSGHNKSSAIKSYPAILGMWP